ncbi:MAG: hypothetical protein AB8B80_00280 [Marinicellaceae bacterium]
MTIKNTKPLLAMLILTSSVLAGNNYVLKKGSTTALTGSGESFNYGASVNAGQVINVNDASSANYIAIIEDPNTIPTPTPSGIFRSGFE